MHKCLSIDIRKCTNCRICEIWCSFTKVGECGPAYSRIRLYPIEEEGITVPNVCSHCEKAYCMTVCPTKALKREVETGAVLLNYEACIGCRMCILACPFGAVFQQPDGKVVKCDLCKGLPEPVCAAHCPKGAIIWEKPELTARSKQKVHSMKLADSLTHGDEEAGGYGSRMTGA